MGNSIELAEDFVFAMGDLTNASSNLTSALETFAKVAKRIEQRHKELDDKEAHLKEVERGIAERIKELAEAERRWEDKQSRMKQEVQSWEEKRKTYDHMEMTIAENIGKLERQVHLNVGGQRFTTTKETLLQFKNSYFEYMLTNPDSQKDRNGEFFIDHDPKYFGMLLHFMREGRIRNSEITTSDLEELMDEFRFYRIQTPPGLVDLKSSLSLPSSPFLLTPRSTPPTSAPGSPALMSLFTPQPPRPASTKDTPKGLDLLCSPVHELHKAFEGGTLLSVDHKTQIADWLTDSRFTLIYKATRDGFLHSDFHLHCDNKGPTLTVIQTTTGNIFGGYTGASWEGSKAYKTDPTSFLFTLLNPHGIEPTAYELRPEETHHAIYCHRSHGPVFGYGCDIYISSGSNENTGSFTRFPHSFVDTTGKAGATFTGSRNFSTSEVEVYAVVFTE